MGLGGISIWQLLIILAIVVLIFGTKKLRGMGGDLGGAIKNFKSAMNDPDAPQKSDQPVEKIAAEENSAQPTGAEAKDKTDV